MQPVPHRSGKQRARDATLHRPKDAGAKNGDEGRTRGAEREEGPRGGNRHERQRKGRLAPRPRRIVMRPVCVCDCVSDCVLWWDVRVRSFLRSFVWTSAFSENEATSNVAREFFLSPGQQRRARGKKSFRTAARPGTRTAAVFGRCGGSRIRHQPTSHPPSQPGSLAPRCRARNTNPARWSRNIPGRGRHGCSDRIAACCFGTSPRLDGSSHRQQQADGIGGHNTMCAGNAGTKSRALPSPMATTRTIRTGTTSGERHLNFFFWESHSFLRCDE